MSDKIGFLGSCTANLNKAPTYINGEKHCYYDCSLKFGFEKDRDLWSAENKKAILLKDFFDIGTKSTSLPDWQQPVCIGQRTELDTKFSPPLPQSRATAFSVDSNDLKANPQKPVTRVIHKLLNQID